MSPVSRRGVLLTVLLASGSAGPRFRLKCAFDTPLAHPSGFRIVNHAALLRGGHRVLWLPRWRIQPSNAPLSLSLPLHPLLRLTTVTQVLPLCLVGTCRVGAEPTALGVDLLHRGNVVVLSGASD